MHEMRINSIIVILFPLLLRAEIEEKEEKIDISRDKTIRIRELGFEPRQMEPLPLRLSSPFQFVVWTLSSP